MSIERLQFVKSLSPIHQSTIKDYLACPKMFSFKHIEKIKPEVRKPAMLHGTVVHKIIEICHKSYWNFVVAKNYSAIMNDIEFNGKDSDINVVWEDRDKEIAKFTRSAVEIIENYRTKDYNQNCTILMHKTEFKVQIRGIDYEGKIDQVRRLLSGEIVLIDFKSGVTKPDINTRVSYKKSRFF